jgi:hypothetical protein
MSSFKQNPVINAFYDFVESKINEDWTAYLTTAMFHPLSGSYLWKVSQMKSEMAKVYNFFLPRIVRYPNPKRHEAMLIGMPDLPVDWKSKSHDGAHFHGILLIPPKSRLKTSIKRHFKDYSTDVWLDDNLIDRVNFELITIKSSRNATDYVFKGLDRYLPCDEYVWSWGCRSYVHVQVSWRPTAPRIAKKGRAEAIGAAA